MAIHVLISPALLEGSALWPEMFPAEKLEQLRREMGTMIFNLQYQNDARLARGSIFRPAWIRKHYGAPEHGLVFTGIDLAVSSKETADYFAAVTVKRVGEDFYVIDARRDRCSFLSQIVHVKRIAEDFTPLRIGVESVAYQAAFTSYLSETTDLPVTPVHPRGDKIARAYRLSALAEAGRLFLAERHVELEEELLGFPDARHDDLLDALEIAISIARKPFRQQFAKIAGI
ncbi:MAG: phage terminase large subunit family protein [Planctomycetota bacterium]|jgi:predicted phage terminase large subunit-like protein